MPCARQAPKIDPRVILVAVSCWERVPQLILRLVATGRRLRSAALLPGGVCGPATKTKSSPYSVRGRLWMCFSTRRHSLAGGVAGSSKIYSNQAIDRTPSRNIRW